MGDGNEWVKEWIVCRSLLEEGPGSGADVAEKSHAPPASRTSNSAIGIGKRAGGRHHIWLIHDCIYLRLPTKTKNTIYHTAPH